MVFLLKIFRLFFGLRVNKKQPLQGEELNNILVSSMYSAQQSAYLNSYSTGLTSIELNNILQNYWGIHNRENTISILDDLISRNKDPYLLVPYNAYEHQENYADILKKNLPEDESTFNYYLGIYRNIRNIIPQILEQKIFDDFSTINRVKDSGWNYGRASFIARCSYDKGYISEQELKEYLHKCYVGLKQYCRTWQEYTSSYVYGRALWGGSHNEGMSSIAETLFKNDKSPLKGRTAI